MVAFTGVAAAITLVGGAPAVAGIQASVAALTEILPSTAVGTVVVDGAIAGSIATGGTATGGAIGAAASGATLMAGLKLASGCLLVGAAESSDGCQGVTYDCWKPVVHDMSTEPSKGMLLKDLIGHSKISMVKITDDRQTVDHLPDIVVTNVWDETFHIDYLRILETNKIVCHARPIVVVG